ncbi:MAG: hypothetical protein KDK54_14195 [Leptospiraceae bacterium]|nr:hypothetical protein [Leptospiraceae bacterium]
MEFLSQFTEKLKRKISLAVSIKKTKSLYGKFQSFELNCYYLFSGNKFTFEPSTYLEINELCTTSKM